MLQVRIPGREISLEITRKNPNDPLEHRVFDAMGNAIVASVPSVSIVRRYARCRSATIVKNENGKVHRQCPMQLVL